MLKRLYLSYVRLNRPEQSEAVTDVDRRVLRGVVLGVITRALLLCYVLFMFRPCMPYVTDAVAHVFWKHEHIAMVHSVKGNTHVTTEVAKSADESQKEKSTGKHKYETAGSEYVIPQTIYPFISYRYVAVVYCAFAQSVPRLYLPPDDIPPKHSLLAR